MAALAQTRVGPHQRYNRDPCRQSCQRASAPNVRRSYFLLLAEEAKSERMLRAGAHAIHAHQAFGFSPWNSAHGIIAPLTVEQAAIAVVAGCLVLVQAQHRKARQCAQQRAQRANRTAPEPRDPQTRRENYQKENPQHQALRKMRLAEIE